MVIGPDTGPIQRHPTPRPVSRAERYPHKAAVTERLRRYLTLLIFNIALTNEDNDGNDFGEPPCISAQQAEQIEALVRETGANLGKFLGIFRVDTAAAIPAGRFGEAMGILRERQQARGGAR